MIKNEPCYVKDATVVNSIVKKDNKEQELLNEIMILAGNKSVPVDKEEYEEKGVLLKLYSQKNNKEYERFMPESLLREQVGQTNPLKDEDLEFYALQMRNRTIPIMVSFISEEDETDKNII